MNDEKWAETKYKIAEKFHDFDENVEDDFLEDDLGNQIPQKTETLVFTSPMGKIKMIRVSHPKIVDRKAHYHKGAGGAKVELVTDETEKSYRFEAYLLKDGEWEKMEVPAERLNF